MILKNPILVTGAAGFIGAALTRKLLDNGEFVVGLDNINDYYEKNLKLDRLKEIEKYLGNNDKNWVFEKVSLEDEINLEKIFLKYKPRVVVNLAAQAGVRYSLKNPKSYIFSNLVGFSNILENCRNFEIENLIYASSSSVYGGNKNLPFSENQQVNHPITLYAATKKSNELMAHSYSYLFGIPSTGLRFFTVYGPWGRPDMAPMLFAKAISDNKPIDVFNYGNMYRDFTFIDDIVEGIFRCCYKPATPSVDFDVQNPEASTSFAPHRIFNIGNSNPINLLKFIEVLENCMGKKAIKDFKPIQLGDVEATAADTSKLKKWIEFIPKTTIEDGVDQFVKWYKKYYLN